MRQMKLIGLLVVCVLVVVLTVWYAVWSNEKFPGEKPAIVSHIIAGSNLASIAAGILGAVCAYQLATGPDV